MDDIEKRLRGILTTVGLAWGDKEGGECFRAIQAAADEIERLRAALNEVITNGEWLSDGDDGRDWLISPEFYTLVVYAMEPSVIDTGDDGG